MRGFKEEVKFRPFNTDSGEEPQGSSERIRLISCFLMVLEKSWLFASLSPLG
jgi:hypothetical protein